MKPKKDIFDLFKDNQHKLNESPPRKAWDRLESRLDQHKGRNQTSIVRILSMAAAIVVLVVSVSVISFWLKSTNWQTADAEQALPHFTTEELRVVNVSNGTEDQIATYQRKYDHHLSSPIQEGKANKKLIARMDLERRDGNLNSFIAKIKRENRQSFSVSSNSTGPPIAEAESKLATPATQIEANKDAFEEIEVAGYTVPQISSHEPSTESAGEGVQDSALEEDADEKKEMENVIVEATPQKNAELYTDEIAAGKAKKQSKDKRSNLSAMSVPSQVASNSIQQFQWLTGKWEGNVNNQISVEQWRQVDERTLEGKGFLIVNGQSTFNEDMKIQEKKGDIYFIADLNGTGKKTKYKLVSNNEFQAVFENKKIDFPNQVVLQRNNLTNFSTIYQNTQPGIIKEEQQNYLLNRNYIQKEQVIRNLRRVND